MKKVELEIKNDRLHYSVEVGEESYGGSKKLTIENFSLFSRIIETIANDLSFKERSLKDEIIKKFIRGKIREEGGEDEANN